MEVQHGRDKSDTGKNDRQRIVFSSDRSDYRAQSGNGVETFPRETLHQQEGSRTLQREAESAKKVHTAMEQMHQS